MDKELAFDILEEYVAKDKTGCVIEALRFIRKELANSLKQPTPLNKYGDLTLSDALDTAAILRTKPRNE